MSNDINGVGTGRQKERGLLCMTSANITTLTTSQIFGFHLFMRFQLKVSFLELENIHLISTVLNIP